MSDDESRSNGVNAGAEALAAINSLTALLISLEASGQVVTTQIYIHDPGNNNNATRYVTVLDDRLDFGASGPRPASNESIDAMPSVVVTEDTDVRECSVCLEEVGVGMEVSEMPCKHGFHPGCIEKWLRIYGSCPICRFVMPKEEQRLDGGDGRGGRHRKRIGSIELVLLMGRSRLMEESWGSGQGSDNSDPSPTDN